ncbi:MAG: SDR family NAD(P)-dependent oxidoreductase, partial [Lachnospiraceae bacterium]|nr:SDR family NAD(P)-dependent oxidoreductase [Lachnospiraceae bacterium]
MLLKDKICLITGTNRGIGKSVLEQFAKEGATIYANARQEGSLDDFAKELNDTCQTTVIPTY